MSIAQEREIGLHTRPSDALLPLSQFFRVPPGRSEKRKEPLEGHLLVTDFRRATCALRAGLQRFYEMGDSELPVAQIKAAPPPRYFNGLLNVSSSIYEENLEASTTKKALTPYYAILLERTRAIFGAVLDAKSHPDREALSRKLWSQDDERGRIMKVVLTQAERTIARDICIGYGFEDRGRIEAAAWGLSYTLETRVASVKSDGDEGPPRQAFLSCLLNTDLGRAAA